MSAQLIEKASRKKYRFQSVKGLLTVEDLWVLALEHKPGSVAADLNTIGLAIQEELGNTKKSLVSKVTVGDQELKDKLDIILYIIATRQSEAEAKQEKLANASANAEEIELLEAIQASQAREALKAKTPEEIAARLAQLKGKAA